jgi:hypothetical protein
VDTNIFSIIIKRSFIILLFFNHETRGRRRYMLASSIEKKSYIVRYHLGYHVLPIEALDVLQHHFNTTQFIIHIVRMQIDRVSHFVT